MANEWQNENFKAILFGDNAGTDAQNAQLIGYLSENADPSSVTPFDLTTLSLSVGAHTIKVKATAAGYADSDFSNSVTYEVYEQLATPAISISGDTLSWAAISHAASYTVYADGSPAQTGVTGTSFDLTTLSLAQGNHSIQLKAIGSGYYTDSELSTAASYNVLPQLAAPTNVSVSDTIATFDPVTNAETYEFFADGTSMGTYAPPSGYTVTTASGFDPTSEWDGHSSVSLTVNGADTYDLTTAVASATIATGVSTIEYDTEAGSGGDLFYTMGGSSGSIINGVTLTLTGDLVITGFNAECLTGDTLVTLADGSTKRLDQIEVGDYVLSYDWNTMEKMARKVILTDKDAHKTHTEYDVWTFDNGSVVKTVHRHEFYNAEAKRFKYMDEWQIGEHALAIDGTLTALVSHEVVKEEVEHYKITLDTSTNYFANGLLTGDRYCPKNISFEGAI